MNIDDTQLLSGLDALLTRITAGVEAGLASEAPAAQQLMQETHAHGDITGATRASYRVFVIGGPHTGSAEAASGYAAAEAAIAANAAAQRGREGHALSQDSGVSLGPDSRGLLYTSYTDYQDKLEVEGKAVLGPTLQQTNEDATRRAAEGSKAALT